MLYFHKLSGKSIVKELMLYRYRIFINLSAFKISKFYQYIFIIKIFKEINIDIA